MSSVGNNKEWLKELRSKTKKLKERAEKKPEPVKIILESKKPVETEKNQYLEIKEEEIVIEKKPEVTVKIEKENDYVVIKPAIDEIKEKAKEELYEEKIEEEKLLEKEKIERDKIPKETELVKEKKVEKIEKSIDKIKTEETGTKEGLIDMVETDIDKLIKIIDKKKAINIGDLSKELNISIDRVESWAKILEDHGLIEIEYPIIGLPKLRKKTWKEKS
jgi:hypothetical protein